MAAWPAVDARTTLGIGVSGMHAFARILSGLSPPSVPYAQKSIANRPADPLKNHGATESWHDATEHFHQGGTSAHADPHNCHFRTHRHSGAYFHLDATTMTNPVNHTFSNFDIRVGGEDGFKALKLPKPSYPDVSNTSVQSLLTIYQRVHFDTLRDVLHPHPIATLRRRLRLKEAEIAGPGIQIAALALATNHVVMRHAEKTARKNGVELLRLLRHRLEAGTSDSRIRKSAFSWLARKREGMGNICKEDLARGLSNFLYGLSFWSIEMTQKKVDKNLDAIQEVLMRNHPGKPGLGGDRHAQLPVITTMLATGGISKMKRCHQLAFTWIRANLDVLTTADTLELAKASIRNFPLLPSDDIDPLIRSMIDRLGREEQEALSRTVFDTQEDCRNEMTGPVQILDDFKKTIDRLQILLDEYQHLKDCHSGAARYESDTENTGPNTEQPGPSATRHPLYARLGLDHDVSDDDLKKTYKELARQTHPDTVNTKGLSAEETAQQKEEATKKFQEISEAYNKILEMRGLTGDREQTE